MKVDDIEFDPKFVVFKVKDAQEYLTITEQRILNELLLKMGRIRGEAGKEPNKSYLVVNVDEPYAGQVAKIMKEYGHYHEEGKFLL